jgi:hypothetical protein
MAERKTGKGSRRSRQEWRSLLAKHEGSGLGVKSFCRRETISAAMAIVKTQIRWAFCEAQRLNSPACAAFRAGPVE